MKIIVLIMACITFSFMINAQEVIPLYSASEINRQKLSAATEDNFTMYLPAKEKAGKIAVLVIPEGAELHLLV